MKVDESSEDTVILLSQFSCIGLGYLISSELMILAAVLFAFNCRDVIVCGTVRLWFVGIFKSAATEKWSEIIPDVDTERTSHPLEKIIRSRA